MLWRLHDVNLLVPMVLRGRVWYSREMASVVKGNHRGASWTEKNPADGDMDREVEEKWVMPYGGRPD